MAKTLLHELLEVGLLDIGDNDKAFNALEGAADELAKVYQGTPKKVISAMVVALDVDAPAADPMLTAAKDAVSARWPTFLNRVHDAPRQLLRMVLFAALVRATADNPRLAAMASLTAAGSLMYRKMGREDELFRRELSLMAQRGEAWALGLFNSPPSFPAQSHATLQVPKFTVPEVEIDVRRVQATVGPHDQKNVQLPEPNRDWPSNNAGWSEQFAPRMAKVIGDAVRKGIDAFGKDLEEVLRQWVAAFEQSVAAQRAAIQVFLSSRRPEEVRTASLWWAKSLYAQKLRKSYRELEAPIAAIAMAHDLHEIVGAPVPASAAYLLGESVRELLGAQAAQPRSLLELVTELERHRESATGAIRAAEDSPGRISMGDACALILHGRGAAAEVLANRVGPIQDVRISLINLAMGCFYDLQASALAQSAK